MNQLQNKQEVNNNNNNIEEEEKKKKNKKKRRRRGGLKKSYWALNSECSNVKVQNIFNISNNITCTTNCEYRTAATIYTQKKWFVSGV
jgi:hypothetical protein